MHVPHRYNVRTGKYQPVTKTTKAAKGKLKAVKQRTQHIRRVLKGATNEER